MDVPSIIDPLAVMRVMAFCMMPKEDMISLCSLVAFFTDGRQTNCMVSMAKRLADERRILIAGSDNLIERDLPLRTASDFRDEMLVDTGISRSQVFVDDTAIYTNGQAASLLRFVRASRQNGRGNMDIIALCVGGHHIVRAWLTVVAALEREEMKELCVFPFPDYTFLFGSENPALLTDRTRSSPTGWQYFQEEALPRIVQYQGKEPLDVAPWDMAARYIEQLERKMNF